MQHTQTQQRSSLNVVDLFCGGGGFTLAAKKAGCRVVFAVENNRHAARTYREHFSASDNAGTTLYENSILELKPVKLAETHFGHGNKCDLVLGGPPCQGFSTHRIKGAGINDPRNRLILSYFEFVKALRPKVFLMENVPGMLWPRHAPFLEELLKEAASASYHVFPPATLDARDFGVPQRRKRVFLLGVREDVDKSGLSWPPEQTHGAVSEGKRRPWVDCSQVFLPAPLGDPNDVHMNHGRSLVEAFRNTPLNGGSRKDSGRTLDCHKKHDGHKDVYGRIDPAKPAPTMTTACINPSKGRFVHPTEHHGITARQAARIQTFPDDFLFHGGLIAAGQQIGNAVPVELGRVLIDHLANWLSQIVDGTNSEDPNFLINGDAAGSIK